MTSGLKRLCLAAFLPVALALTACQTVDVGAIDIAGQQAIVSTTAPAAKVREVLVYQAIGKNREVMTDTPTLLVIDMSPNDFLYTVIERQGINLTARTRVTYMFTPSAGGTRIAASASLVSNRGGSTTEIENYDGNPDVAAALTQQLNDAIAVASRG